MSNMMLVETMTQAPNACMACGKGNVPDRETGKVGPFLYLGIDYNWGDSGYMCEDCVGKAAVFFDWISPDTKRQFERKIKKLEQKIHDLEGEIDMRRRREHSALQQARAKAS
jgi:hypothetical protein